MRCRQDAVTRRTVCSARLSRAERVDGRQVAVEIEGYDSTQRAGWCVLITGRAREITADPGAQQLLRLDVVPWAPGRRDRWFAVEPQSMSGRRVADPHGAVGGWFPGIPAS